MLRPLLLQGTHLSLPLYERDALYLSPVSLNVHANLYCVEPEQSVLASERGGNGCAMKTRVGWTHATFVACG
jgi:hypothetical protein